MPVRCRALPGCLCLDGRSTIDVRVRIFGHTKQFGTQANRPLLSPTHSLKSATAKKQSSSLSQCPSSRASTKSSNGKPFSTSPPTPHHHNPSTNRPTLTPRPLPYSLTRELEKKFSDRHVLFLASRRILPRPKRSNRSRTSQTQKRPHSRTLTAVHDAILGDVVYPVEIVGKRTRTREDGSKVLKVVLDEKERGGVDYRLDTYAEVYRKLTGKGVGFEFPLGGPAEY